MILLSNFEDKESGGFRDVAINRPFAWSGPMIQNRTCWDASFMAGLPKQRQVAGCCVPLRLCNLPPSMFGFVPCDRVVKKTCCIHSSPEFTQDPVHTRHEEFENRGFNLKTHQMFSSTLREFKNETITGCLGFVFQENWARTGKSNDYREFFVWEKLLF